MKPAAPAPRRQKPNAPCACGSGKKYKKCCKLTQDTQAHSKHALAEEIVRFEAAGKHHEAIVACEQLLRIETLPNQRSWLFSRIGTHYILLGEERKAEAPLSKAVELHDSPMAWNDLGYVYTALERHDEAICAYENALKIFQLTDSHPETQDSSTAVYSSTGGTTTAGSSGRGAYATGKFDASEVRVNLQIARTKAARACMSAKVDRLDEMTDAFASGDTAKLAELRKEPQENFLFSPHELHAHVAKLTQQCEELKGLGNSMFKMEEYETAISHYTESLSLCGGISFDVLRATLLGNRCEAYLQTEQWRAAKIDADTALQLTATFVDKRLHQKCQTRLSRARAGIKGGVATATKKRETSDAADKLIDEAMQALFNENWKLADKRFKKVVLKLKSDDPRRPQALHLNADVLHHHWHDIDGVIQNARASALNTESIEAYETALSNLEAKVANAGMSDPNLRKAREIMDSPLSKHLMNVSGLPALSNRERAQQTPQWLEMSYWLLHAVIVSCWVNGYKQGGIYQLKAFMLGFA